MFKIFNKIFKNVLSINCSKGHSWHLFLKIHVDKLLSDIALNFHSRFTVFSQGYVRIHGSLELILGDNTLSCSFIWTHTESCNTGSGFNYLETFDIFPFSRNLKRNPYIWVVLVDTDKYTLGGDLRPKRTSRQGLFLPTVPLDVLILTV